MHQSTAESELAHLTDIETWSSTVAVGDTNQNECHRGYGLLMPWSIVDFENSRGRWIFNNPKKHRLDITARAIRIDSLVRSASS